MGSPKVHILELNLISAQDLKLEGINKRMKTYAVAWIDPKKKLRSRIDAVGGTNPTWNDKFLFEIDAHRDFRSSNPALEINIYRVRRLWKDKRIGIIRILLDNLINEIGIGSNNSLEIKVKFMAFQIRRPSGTPEGILNLGFTKVNGFFNQANGFIESSSMALDHRVLMGKEKGKCSVMKGEDLPLLDLKKIEEDVIEKEGLLVVDQKNIHENLVKIFKVGQKKIKEGLLVLSDCAVERYLLREMCVHCQIPASTKTLLGEKRCYQIVNSENEKEDVERKAFLQADDKHKISVQENILIRIKRV